MAWDEAINTAFDSGDATEFHRLLKLNPEFLRSPNGSDRWMWQAAMDGKLAIIEALVDLGMNVNESRDLENSDDPFYTPEGCILQAAGGGHLELVHWLLKHGAKINYVVHGEPRCWPLVDAASHGHLNVVKLLIEHGADFRSTWQGVNAITQAETFGQWDVYDYLHSLGARTLCETTPPDYPTAHRQIKETIAELRGPLSNWEIEISGIPPVVIHLIPPNERCDVQTLFTVGLSDHRLPHGRREFACSELRMMLPENWPLDTASLKDPKWNWPVEWMKRIVLELRDATRWPAEPAVFMNGDPAAPLGPGTNLCGWMCLLALGEAVDVSDRRQISVYDLFPIYIEERELIGASGHEVLLNRFLEHDIPLYIDPQRLNGATDLR